MDIDSNDLIYDSVRARMGDNNKISSSKKFSERKKGVASLSGKSDVYRCAIEIHGDVKNYDFLKINHFEHGEVLCQVINITRELDIMTGIILIIGYRQGGKLQRIRKPFSINAEIDLAEDKFIEEVLGLNKVDGAFLGTLEHHENLNITLDLRKVLQKHVSILAKSGAGKSYTVGVLLEEIVERGIPVLILDPHSEYHTLKFPNDEPRDIKKLQRYELSPKGYGENIQEYSTDLDVNSGAKEIKLDINKLEVEDFIDSLPGKITPSQTNILMNVLNNLNNRINLDELIFNVSNEESNTKWSLITMIERLKKFKIYSNEPTSLQELIQFGKASVLSLKGVDPQIRDTLVTQLLKQLFDARKKDQIPPFFLVLEEAHNFASERGSGITTKSLNIIRTLAGEGRKFGLGLCVISQRPAKVDKNVLSQCGTQIVMKVTNPNDLKSILASCEGMDNSSAQEISQLDIGTCMLTGINETPLKVNVRPRMSKHGGEGASLKLQK
jgi:DNA helicase HerA-like ATPase